MPHSLISVVPSGFISVISDAKSRGRPLIAARGRETDVFPADESVISQVGRSSFTKSCTLGVAESSLRRLIVCPLPKVDLRKSDVPEARSRPLSMIATVSPRASASSMLWVVRSMTRSAVFSRCIIVHTRRLLRGSIPVDGSSRNIIRGCATDAIPTLSLRFMPPENVATWLSASASRLTSARMEEQCSSSSAK